MSLLMEWILKHAQVLAALAELPNAVEDVSTAVKKFATDEDTQAKVMDVFQMLAILLAHFGPYLTAPKPTE